MYKAFWNVLSYHLLQPGTYTYTVENKGHYALIIPIIKLFSSQLNFVL